MLDAIKSNKLLLIIAGTLVAIIVIGLLAFSLLQSQDDTKKAPAPAQVTSPQAETPQPTTVNNDAPQEDVAQNTDDFAALVDDSLLEQPIATDPALLKDELVQLSDIQMQLNEQKELLEQQNADSDKLIELKEKQLLALQKQLEASEIQ